MKKALVVLLILAVAGGLFAQELTWSGAVKTGLEFYADDDDTNGKDLRVKINNDDAGVTSRFDLSGAYTQDNWGVKFRLRTDIGATAGPVLNRVFGWATFFDNILKFSAGILDTSWGSNGVEGYDIGGTGLRLEVTPIEGLNFGLILNVPKYPLTIGQYLSETILGVKYEADLFWLAAALNLDGTIDGLSADGVGTTTPAPIATDPAVEVAPGAYPPDITEPHEDSDKGAVFYAGVGVTAIPGLTLDAEAKGFNVGKFDTYGKLVIDERAAYKLLDDKLEVGIKAYQTLYADKSEIKPRLAFTPFVGYDVLDNLNVGLEVTYGLQEKVIDYDLAIKPKLTYKISDKAKIVAFYKFFTSDLYEEAIVPGTTDKKASSNNTVQIDLIWEF